MESERQRRRQRIWFASQRVQIIKEALLSVLLLIVLAACNADVKKPVPIQPTLQLPMPLTPPTQPTRLASDADIELIGQAADALRNLTLYHYEISSSSTTIKGDVVRTEGASMIGRYLGTPVAILIRDGQFFRLEGDAWVAKSITDVLYPLIMRPLPIFTDTVKEALEQVLDPIDATRDSYSAFPVRYSFPRPVGWLYDIRHGVYIVGEEMMHGARVTHYSYISCRNCFGNMPVDVQSSAWIDPQTKYVHKYAVELLNSYQISIILSRHDDPTLKLPAP